MFIILVLQLLVLETSTGILTDLGKPCSHDWECNRVLSDEVCGAQGYCECRHGQLGYSIEDDLKPVCYKDTSIGFSPKCNCDRNASCRDNVCVCYGGYVTLITHDSKSTCHRGKSVRPLGKCFREVSIHHYTTNLYYCDYHSNLICEGGVCHCLRNYYLDKWTGRCELMYDYLKTNNLKEYRVKPGEYCRDEGDCIEGLECRNFTCACPGHCEYKVDIQVCDCGEDEVSSTGPIVTGIILGILIIGFWIWRIKKTIRGDKERKARTRLSSPVFIAPEESSTTTYHLSPLNPSTNTTSPSAPMLAGQSSSPNQGGDGECSSAPTTGPFLSSPSAPPQPVMVAGSFPPLGDSSHPHYPADKPPPYSSLPPSATDLHQGPLAVNPSSIPYPVSPLGAGLPGAPAQAGFTVPSDQPSYSLDPHATSAKPFVAPSAPI